MQRAIPPVLALLAICLSVLAYRQHSENNHLRSQLARITAERDASLETVATARTVAATATENVARLTTERNAAIERAKGGGAPPPMPMPGASPKGADESGGKTMMQGIAKMFGTEEGKKMMRAQMAMGIKMQYGGLAKELNLDPQVADQVLGLLADRQAAMSEMTFAAMKDGTLDAEGTKTIGAKSEALKKEYDEKLRAILDDKGMAQFNDYERTANDRAMLSMHEQQFAAAGVPLEQPQRDALVQIMKDERLKTPASALDASGNSSPARAFSAMADDAAVEKWMAREEDYQRRVLQAAPGTLNPDQVNALQQAFKQQLEMQRFGVKMGREMFKGGSRPATPAPEAAPAK
jgi:hypothetical protein